MVELSNECVEIAQVFHFEFWLRYYFITEREDGIYIELTAQQKEQMRTQFPDFWELVDRVLDQPLSPELSQKAVGEFLEFNYVGKKIPANLAPKVLDSKEFSAEMLLFDTWVDLHEEQLMQKIYGFDYWMHAFSEWKQSSQGQQLRQSLALQMQAESPTTN